MIGKIELYAETTCYNHFMKLSVPGSYFDLSLLGYQYPDAEGEPYDANWLVVRIDAAGPQGAWSAADPCLLTYEAEQLANWLEAIPSGGSSPAISFLEPVLLFRQVEREGGETFLRVHFGNLIYPSWTDNGPANQAELGNPYVGNPRDLWLDFPIAEIDLPAAARDLREQLQRFPRRTER